MLTLANLKRVSPSLPMSLETDRQVLLLVTTCAEKTSNNSTWCVIWALDPMSSLLYDRLLGWFVLEIGNNLLSVWSSVSTSVHSRMTVDRHIQSHRSRGPQWHPEATLAASTSCREMYQVRLLPRCASVHLSLQNPRGMRAAPLSGFPWISGTEKQNLQDRVLLTCFSFGHRLLIHHSFSVLLGSVVLNLLESEDQIGTVPLLTACGLENTHTIVRLSRRYWTRDELFFGSLQFN